MLFDHEDDYNDVFAAAADAYGVDAAVLKAFAATESAFKPDAFRQEAKDASYGLMQLLLGTARGLGYPGAPAGLYDPATNVNLGAQLLAQLYGTYPDFASVASAYNAGHLIPETDPDKIAAGYQFVNQPYVWEVGAYASYFKAKAAGDQAAADSIEQMILNQQFQQAFATAVKASGLGLGALILIGLVSWAALRAAPYGVQAL